MGEKKKPLNEWMVKFRCLRTPASSFETLCVFTFCKCRKMQLSVCFSWDCKMSDDLYSNQCYVHEHSSFPEAFGISWRRERGENSNRADRRCHCDQPMRPASATPRVTRLGTHHCLGNSVLSIIPYTTLCASVVPTLFQPQANVRLSNVHPS